ncbi:hypothetical protein HDU96_000139 [Phlyctochytrium bullatum]|nr:hypothetical protein HDU96_000139 [Phlyctochytrium bullatum]
MKSTSAIARSILLASGIVIMAASQLASAQIKGDAASPQGYSYEGCFVDKGKPRSMAFLGYQGMVNSVNHCAKTCSALGYPYSGSEYAGECYCDNRIAMDRAPEAECNRTCPGAPDTICGGNFRLSVYSVQPKVEVAYSRPNQTTPFLLQYIGCGENPLPERVLNYQPYATNATMTIEGCAGACRDNNYPIMGLEYGNECWCGYKNPYKRLNDTDCFMHCSGNLTDICGGPARLSMYIVKTSSARRDAARWILTLAGGALLSFLL